MDFRKFQAEQFNNANNNEEFDNFSSMDFENVNKNQYQNKNVNQNDNSSYTKQQFDEFSNRMGNFTEQDIKNMLANEFAISINNGFNIEEFETIYLLIKDNLDLSSQEFIQNVIEEYKNAK